MAPSNLLVIVVEDDAVRNSLKFSLEIDGFSVRIYASAEELLHPLDLQNCQCLIVDQDMPRMTGLDLVASLRNEGILIPAILISERVTATLARRALDAGITVIEKPFLGNALVELIRAATRDASK